MYIIHQPNASQTLYHRIGARSSEGGAVSVALHTRSSDDPFEWENHFTIPIADTSMQAVADWLVSPAGFYFGGQIASNATVEVTGLKIHLSRMVKRKREAVEYGGCMTAYGPIDTNPSSQLKLGGGSTAALVLGAAFSKVWRMADNSLVTFDQPKMLEVGLTVVAHVDACQQRKNVLDAEIEAAETLEDLEAIDIETGWPS